MVIGDFDTWDGDPPGEKRRQVTLLPARSGRSGTSNRRSAPGQVEQLRGERRRPADPLAQLGLGLRNGPGGDLGPDRYRAQDARPSDCAPVLPAQHMRKLVIIAAPCLAAAVAYRRRCDPFSFDPAAGRVVWELETSYRKVGRYGDVARSVDN
jgi:hypothetical protein